jgi:hypothetical protein
MKESPMYIIMVEWYGEEQQLYIGKLDAQGNCTFASELENARRWRKRQRAQDYYEREFRQHGISGIVVQV